MVRTPGYDKSGLKKGTWTPEEDRKLREYVTKYGCWNWRQLPKYAGLARCGKSCRLRWMNYLRPNIKRGNYSKEEEDIIIRLHEKLGNRWSAIAAQLPGRTDNEIKNHWHTYLKKQGTQNTTSNEANLDNGSTHQTTSDVTIPNDDFSQCTASGSSGQESEVEGEEVAEANNMHPQDPTAHKINETSCSMESSCSPQQPQMEFSSMATDYTLMVEDYSDTLDNFWSEPFLSESLLMLNNDFSAEGMMYPTGLLSPPYSAGCFDGEQYDEYDNLFSNF